MLYNYNLEKKTLQVDFLKLKKSHDQYLFLFYNIIVLKTKKLLISTHPEPLENQSILQKILFIQTWHNKFDSLSKTSIHGLGI
jgi:hypothetical protein